jgi:hypothetical protein
MQNRKVKFVRIRGRLVPIKQKLNDLTQGKAAHSAFAAQGAIQHVVGRLGSTATKERYVGLDNVVRKRSVIIRNKKAAFVAGTIALAGTAANLTNAIQHGRKEGVLSGVGRIITNKFARFGGRLGANVVRGTGVEVIKEGNKAFGVSRNIHSVKKFVRGKK